VLRLETTVAQRVSHVEQELHTFSEHLCASCVFIGVRVAHCIHFCAMFVHITVCPFVLLSQMSRIFLSMCDVKVFLTFTSPNMVLL
jgi:hypothetical protein